MPTNTASDSGRRSASSRHGRLRDRLPAPARTWMDFVTTVADAGDRNELSLFAAATAFSLVISLAPLTLALRFVGLNVAEFTGAVSGSPLEPGDISIDALAGSFGWAGSFAIGLAGLMAVWGATRFFMQVAEAIRRIWGDGGIDGGLREMLHSRLLSTVLLFVLAAALSASALVGSTVGVATDALSRLAGSLGIELGWLRVALSGRLLVDFAFAALLLLVTFTIVPGRPNRPAELLPGVLVTAAAYAIGQSALGVYLSSSSRFDALGTFGSFIALLLWAYYTALIIIWGAEATFQLASQRAAGASRD